LKLSPGVSPSTGAQSTSYGGSGRSLEPREARYLVLLLACLLGAYLRLWPALTTDFPLNDGGLFWLMSRELVANDWRLPGFTSYNGAGIPFAYPPFAFYLAAAVSSLTGLSLLDVVRVLPAVWSALTVPAFAWLCRALLREENGWCVAAATWAFAVLPRSFEVCIIGGGLTRAPGFVWLLLALGCLVRWLQTSQAKWGVGAAVFAALTWLTHPTVSWLLVYSSGVFWLFHGRTVAAALKVLLMGLGAALLSAPWWLSVVSQHGIAPFVAAFGTKQYAAPWVPLLFFDFAGETLLEVGAVLGWLGLFVVWARRLHALPVWLLAMFVLQPRGVAVYASMPLAMLIGLALTRLVMPGIAALNPPRARKITAALCAALAFYGTVGAWLAGLRLQPEQSMEAHERAALQWVARHTPASMRFAVLTGQDVWQDPLSEWFPVLAQRHSVATVQGYEWLPHSHNARWQQFEQLQGCLAQDAECLEKWQREVGRPFDAVYVRRPSAGRGSAWQRRALRGMEDSLQTSGYRAIYDGQGASIWRKTSPAS
jgi:hypothetical protein